MSQTSYDSARGKPAYEPLHRFAVWHGLKILPVVVGAPAWLRSEETAAAPNGLLYPVGSEALNCLGGFVVATIRQFNKVVDCIDAIEIWSEPNNPRTGFIADPRTFGRMVATAAMFAEAENVMGAYRRPKQIVSGGVVLGDGVEPWEPYLDSSHRELFPFIVGVHARGDSAGARTAHEYAERITAQVGSAVAAVAEATSGEVWLTSTGATSAGPWGEAGQAAALASLSQHVAEVPECSAMVVTPLLEVDPVDAGEAGETLLQADGTAKPALAALTESWVGGD